LHTRPSKYEGLTTTGYHHAGEESTEIGCEIHHRFNDRLIYIKAVILLEYAETASVGFGERPVVSAVYTDAHSDL